MQHLDVGLQTRSLLIEELDVFSGIAKRGKVHNFIIAFANFLKQWGDRAEQARLLDSALCGLKWGKGEHKSKFSLDVLERNEPIQSDFRK
jgi:hypothetical protein